MNNTIFFIPIRSGSKGLTDKNVLFLLDRPVFQYSIDAIINAGFEPESIYVSSDSQAYLDIVDHWNDGKVNTILRSEKLSADGTTTFEVLSNFLTMFEDSQKFMLVQATTPLKNAQHIWESLTIFDKKKDTHSVVAVSKLNEPVNLITKIDQNGFIGDLDKVDQGYRRQNQSQHYIPNGSIFISTKKQYLEYGGFFAEKTVPYVMEEQFSIDIDTAMDFKNIIGQLVTKQTKKDIDNIESSLCYLVNKIDSKKPKILIGDSRWVDFVYDSIENISVNGLSLHVLRNIIENNAFNNSELTNKTIYISLGINDVKNNSSYEDFKNDLKQVQLYFDNQKNTSVVWLPILPSFGRMDIKNDLVLKNQEALMKMKGYQDYLDMSFKPWDYFDGLHFRKSIQSKIYYYFIKMIEKGIVKES